MHVRPSLLVAILLLAILSLGAGLVSLPGCGPKGEATDAWRPVPDEALSATQRTQRKKAFDARDVMFAELSGALLEAIQAKGPAGAIDVCRSKAPALAAEVSEARNLEIGRTAQRLRNAANEPPAWAEPYVEQGQADNLWLAHADGRLAALLPIRLQNACLTCHGKAESLSEEVRKALATHYPDDQATGFEAGDLRGWFWLEVPAPKTYGDAR